MARNLNMAVFAALVAALVISSVSAVTHQVGDGLGWNIPPGGAVAYSTWSSNNTFKAGDILVFTFASGQHDVAEVTKEAFDACNATAPISLKTDSPANLTLTSGEHYYICTFGGHCSAGQKLAVNVTGTTSSPSPAPSISPPTSSPAPVLAPEPSSSASPPAPSAPTPSTTATPPSTSATPPSGTTTPSTPAPAGDVTPPPSPNAATSLGVAGPSATFLSIAVALFMF
ncbi:blue copper protein [Rosa sericea]